MFNTIPEIQALHTWAVVSAAKVQARSAARNGTRRRDERGAADLATVVILVALFAVAALAIGAIIVTKFTDKANNIPTE